MVQLRRQNKGHKPEMAGAFQGSSSNSAAKKLRDLRQALTPHSSGREQSWGINDMICIMRLAPAWLRCRSTRA